MKITGSGEIFNHMKNAAEQFKQYINRRPHKMPKSEDHPFGGWDNRHGAIDFGYKVFLGVVLAGIMGVTGVSVHNSIEKYLQSESVATEQAQASKVDAVVGNTNQGGDNIKSMLDKTDIDKFKHFYIITVRNDVDRGSENEIDKKMQEISREKGVKVEKHKLGINKK